MYIFNAVSSKQLFFLSMEQKYKQIYNKSIDRNDNDNNEDNDSDNYSHTNTLMIQLSYY